MNIIADQKELMNRIEGLLEPVWNLLNIIKLKKGIIISNLTVN
ncbi:hypothetical protein [Spiroplasma endosymbiont of Dactylopius coccus]